MRYTLLLLPAFAIAAMLLAQDGDGLTPLHKAVEKDDIAAVKTLLANGANANAATTLGHVTPLALAANDGDAAIIQILLDAHAEVDTANADGATPLMLAAASGSVDAIKVLLDHGAAINAKEPLRGETPLFFAAGSNRAAAIRFLISRGADPALTSTVVNLARPAFDEDGNPIQAAAGRGGARAGTGRGGAGRQGAFHCSATVTGVAQHRF